MKRQRRSEEQFTSILKEREGGMKRGDRKRGIGEATFYNWKAKYGG
jgi:putative transposase